MKTPNDHLETTLTEGLLSLVSACQEPHLFLEAVLDVESEQEMPAPASWEAVGVPSDRQPTFAPSRFRWSGERKELTLSYWKPIAEEPIRKLLSAPDTAERDDLDAFEQNKRLVHTETIVLGRKQVPICNMYIPLDQPIYDIRTIATTLKRIVERHEAPFAVVDRFYLHNRGNPFFLQIFDRTSVTSGTR